MKRIVSLIAVLVMLLSVFVMPVAAQAEIAPVSKAQVINAVNAMPEISEVPLRTWYLRWSFKQYQMRKKDGYFYVRFKVRNDSNFAITKLQFQFTIYDDEWKIDVKKRFTKTVKSTIKAHKTAWTKWIKLTKLDERYYITKVKPFSSTVSWKWFEWGAWIENGYEWVEE